jgi:hypothetical protein
MNYTLYRYVPKSLGPKLGPRIPQPWFWTITAMDYPPPSTTTTREQAMADFKARWPDR